LNSALNKEKEMQEKIEESEEKEISKIDTTEEELDAYRIVVAILRRKIPIERIAYRDTQSYFGILLDDNNRKPLCRLHLNTSNKYIGIFDENKKETKHLIDTIDDIYNFESQILKTADLFSNG
jgi:hypothetical protein